MGSGSCSCCWGPPWPQPCRCGGEIHIVDSWCATDDDGNCIDHDQPIVACRLCGDAWAVS